MDKAKMEQELEQDVEKAIKAARPHLLRAWAKAKALGQSRPFSEWIDTVFSEEMAADLGREMHQNPATTGILTRARSLFD